MSRETLPRIRKLSPAVVAKIAAGEMILRPVSVAKELLENALDASATRIEIEIHEAADRYLSVADDGCGMSEEELRLAIERHATSKLTDEAGLEKLSTLGFRGEALPSIARVARVRIATAREREAGTELTTRGGELEEVRPVARPRGTTVTVEDLFFNSPVRKRFLRSPAGEMRLIQRLISAYALPRPDVEFRLIVDGKETVHFTETDATGRLEQVYGARFREKVIPLRGQHPRVKVGGWVGIPEISRTGTQGQTIIVNGRWISHPPLGQALRQGFSDLIPPTKQPFAVLLLDISTESVDVNVHPTKREIRFSEEALVFAEVLRTVREATSGLVPGFSGTKEGWTASSGAGSAGPIWDRQNRSKEEGGGQRALDRFEILYAPTSQSGVGREGLEPIVHDAPWHTLQEGEEQAPMVPLWQVRERYIVAQTKQGLLIVDQHAAHERILYEKALRYLAGEQATSQQLLFPVVVQLQRGEYEALEAIIDELGQLGIDIEPFGGDAIALRSIPATWRDDPGTMLRELLDDLTARTRRREERIGALAASYACHSAIRSGTKLDLESMNRLVDELFSTETPHGDPHGRPTYVVLSLEDLDRRFGRSG